jgi:hypothetical protein
LTFVVKEVLKGRNGITTQQIQDLHKEAELMVYVRQLSFATSAQATQELASIFTAFFL